MIRTGLLSLFVCGWCLTLQAQPTPAAPAEQIPKFRLPPGFEIQLVVADPHIGQPMNLNFDAQGRLWITHSVEYPYPAKGEGVEPRPARFPGVGDHPPRDRLTVVAGIGPDGKPASIKHFAEGLNIPIGQTPLGDGSRAVVYGIPSIFLCEDTNGDGTADKRSTLFTRFGNIDVHGNASSFTRWIDGWVYGCHGFSNSSEITDGEGNVTRLNSGNSYRFREDGSRFEQFTWGQVNPFGLTFDPWGNLYVSDCHSKPLYLLLRGASYPQFGSQPPPLGFGPEMIDHNHGSTGICGPAYYAAEHFPEEYRDNIFICNPVSGRVHRDKLKQFGSSYRCDTQPDFISTGDKWFRPVDAIVGPDGALYVADFCNLIIGHYEAPLEHPDRDRTHGRVWRVVYTGEDGKSMAPPIENLTKLPVDRLIERLGDPNLLVRTLATNYLVDTFSEANGKQLQAEVTAHANPHFRAHALWVLERGEGLVAEQLARHAKDSDPLVRTHMMRIVAERAAWDAACEQIVRRGLADENAFVVRAAADAAGRQPSGEMVPALLAAWQQADPQDTHLVHTVRLALAASLSDPVVAMELLEVPFDEPQQARLLEIASATESKASLPLLLRFAKPGSVPLETLLEASRHVARHGTREQLTALIERGRDSFPEDPHSELKVLTGVVRGLQAKGERPEENQRLKDRLSDVVKQVLEQQLRGGPMWTTHPVEGLPPSASPWGLRNRRSADGQDAVFYDSIVGGESLTGLLRSRPFELPAEFSFWLCGHNGPPGNEDAGLNFVRLVLADVRGNTIPSPGGTEIARVLPPRNDTAQQVVLKLPDYAGRQVRLEAVDGHQGNAYAWLAVSRFDPPLLVVPQQATPNEAQQLFELAGLFRMHELAPQLAEIVEAECGDESLRIAALNALEAMDRTTGAQATLIRIVTDAKQPDALRAKAATALGAVDSAEARAALVAMLSTSAGELQAAAAAGLVRTPAGVSDLIPAVESGKASPRLLGRPAIAEGIRRHATDELRQQAEKLAADLPPQDPQTAARMAQLRASFATAKTDPAHGKQVFLKHCAACHRIGQEGHLVGPQLDGVGGRGVDRLLEDILDPNRNIDQAFRTTVYVTVDGKVINGLERARDGKTIVIADAEGKEIRLAADDVEESYRSQVSLMPTTVTEKLPASDLHNLLAWLLENRQPETKK